jgi:Mn2+/Fe2+ NRAMP family transporter
MSRFLARPFNVTLSIAAGMLGGTVAPYIFPSTSVHAQAQIAPKTLEAGTLRLVNEAGHVAGSLTINAAGSGVVTMFDADGNVIFTSDNKPVIKPAIGH